MVQITFGEQIDTILAQTYPLHEFLIFDDASVDDTYTILQAYATNNALIRLYKNENNIGYAANFKKSSSCSTR